MDTLLSVAERRAPVPNSASSRMEAEDEDRDNLTHLRPRILRRETSQILSYYHSADAGRSDSVPYACAYRSASPDADSFDASQDAHVHDRSGSYTESRSTSPSSTYSSDYGVPHREHIENKNIGDGNAERNGNEDGTPMQYYRIAIGKSGGNTLSTGGMTMTAPASGTGTDVGVAGGGTDVGTGYGSRITTQLNSDRRPSPAQPSPQFHLPLPQSQQTWPERGQTQAQTAPAAALAPMSGAPGVSAPAPTATVDPVADPGIEPDVAPGRRRRISSRGAADKRRVAIVQVDSETDMSEREREQEEGHAREGEYLNGGLGTLRDGYGRVEAYRIGQGQQQTHAQFSAFGQSPSSSNSHPPSAFYSLSATSSTKSTGGSALLLRRGINGTFALVAPPDASPSAYANLSYFTPPLSAPISAHPTPPLLARHESAESSTTNTSDSSSRLHHQRSQSEAILTGTRGAGIHTGVNVNAYSNDPSRERRRPGGHLRKRSRDIGIVGTSTSISPTSENMKTDEQSQSEEAEGRTVAASDKACAHPGQLSPIFQTPSLSQAPFLSSESVSSARTKEPQVQWTSTSEDKKRRSQPHSTSNSSSTGSSITSTNNGTERRSPREEKHTNPAGVGADSKQTQHAPYPSLSASSAAPSLHHHIMTTSSPPSSVSSLHTVGTPTSASAPSPYLHYQPGLHATAGPLPSPPRQIIPPARASPPPPRPPRLHAPSSGASSLAKRKSDTSINSKHDHTQMQEKELTPPVDVGPPQISAPVMTPSTTSSTLVNSQSEDSVKGKGHTREGAFPITSVIVTDATPAQLLPAKQEQQALKRGNTMDKLVKDMTAAIDQTAAAQSDSSIPNSKRSDQAPVVHNQVSKDHEMRRSRSGMDLSREDSRTAYKRTEKPPRSPSSIYSDDEYDNIAEITITKPLPEPVFTSPPSSPRTEPHEVNHIVSKPQKIIDYALKRFSTLPRPPSRLSATRASPRSSTSRERHSHEPSERSDHGHAHVNASPRKRTVIVPKLKSPWPDAMSFGDVLAKKSPLERSLAYARKINELANHDPGLGDWVVITKHNLVSSSKGTKRKSVSPVAVKSPSERSFTFQPRHPSRGSIGSEMTFPKRVDAYVATDLLQRTPEDQKLPQGPPPTLPYPTLAHGPPPQQNHQQPPRLGGSSSVRSNQSSVGTGKPSGGGFFASIGRKASVKKDRPVLQNVQPNKLLTKRQQAAAAIPPMPRPVQISASPSLPGGPRAPPGRVQRAQSVIAPRMTGMGSAAAESEPDVGRRRSIKRSPSVVPLPRTGSNTGNGAPTDIEVKVGKLADLLPHADRKTLAGYLRRAGGMDMVAIGRYLDDEKNGTLIRD